MGDTICDSFILICSTTDRLVCLGGVSEYTVASNMVRNRIFYSEIRSIKKDGNTLLIPRHDIFHVYKVFLFDIWKQFYIMSESIELSLTRYPVIRLRHVCLYQRSIFVLYFLLSVGCSAWRTTKYSRHYWQQKHLLRKKVENPVPEHTFCTNPRT